MAKVVVYLVAYSHIDTEWLWNLEEAINACRDTFTKTINLIEKYSGIVFGTTTTYFFEELEKLYPALLNSIRNLVRRGRWEFLGGTFVEFDANMPSGESIVRHLLRGFRHLKSRFGIAPSVLFLPDTFGFPSTLPKLLGLSGIKYFITYKLAWNDTNEYPYHIFRWVSGDQEVITYILPGTYSDYLSDERRIIFNVLKQLRKQGIPLVLVTYGKGDHGGGPREDEVENVSRWVSRGLNTVKVVAGNVTEFLKKLDTSYRIHLPLVKDELYLEFHRGVYTTGAAIKKLNRLNENLILQVEKLYSILALQSILPYPKEELDTLWRDLMLSQGHDALPATLTEEVFEEVVARSYKVFQNLLTLIRKGVKVALRAGSGYAIFNPLNWKTDTYIRTKNPLPGTVGQKLRSGEQLVYLKNLPPLGVTLIDSLRGVPEGESKVIKGKEKYILENPFIRVEVDRRTGWVTSIYNKVDGFETLSGPLKLVLLWDIPAPFRGKTVSAALFDSWEAYYRDFPNRYFRRNLKAYRVSIGDSGPLYASVVSSFKYTQLTSGTSKFELEYGVYADKPFLEIRFRAYWKARHRFLKLSIPLAVKGKVYSEAPYGVEVREDACLSKDTRKRAKYEVYMHKWVDVSDGVHGVAVINDSRYGFSFCYGELGISLLRSPMSPLKELIMKFEEQLDEAQRKYLDISLSEAGTVKRGTFNLLLWLLSLTRYLADLKKHKPIDTGYHIATLWIYPHRGDYSAAMVPKYASELNTIYLPVRLEENNSVKEGGEHLRELINILNIEPAGIVDLVTIKPTESRDGYVLRLFNTSPKTVETTIKLNIKVLRAFETDLMERILREIEVEKYKTNNTLKTRLGPHEVKSIVIVPKPALKNY